MRRFYVHPRFVSREDEQYIKDNYGTVPVNVIAKHIGRCRLTVISVAVRLGVTRKRTGHGDAFTVFLTRHHALGWSDTEISTLWSLAHPDNTISRDTVTRKRKSFGLSSNASSHHTRRKVWDIKQQQLANSGVPNISAWRIQAFQRFAESNGWPSNMRAREVHILNALYELGPQTRHELSERLGFHVRGGHYLASLIRQKFVVAMKYARKAHGPTRSTRVHVYCIPIFIIRGEQATWPSPIEIN